jgi:hypothetical protein
MSIWTKIDNPTTEWIKLPYRGAGWFQSKWIEQPWFGEITNPLWVWTEWTKIDNPITNWTVV